MLEAEMAMLSKKRGMGSHITHEASGGLAVPATSRARRLIVVTVGVYGLCDPDVEAIPTSISPIVARTA